MDESKKAHALAAYYLGKRAYGTEELRKKLHEKGYEDVAIDPVIEDFTIRKILDDDAVLRRWFEGVAQRRGYGYLLAKKKLRERGFGDNEIDEVYADVYRDIEADIALAAARKKKDSLRRDPEEKQKEKTARFLVSRGFSQYIVYEVLDVLF